MDIIGDIFSNNVSRKSFSADDPISYNSSTGKISLKYGSGLDIVAGELVTIDAGGSVTDFIFIDGAGFTGNVNNSNTTPELSLTISDSRILTAAPNVTKAGESYLSLNTITQVLTANAINLSGTNVTGGLGQNNAGTGNTTGYGTNRLIFQNSGNTAFTSSSNLTYDGSTLVALGVGTTTNVANSIAKFGSIGVANNAQIYGISIDKSGAQSLLIGINKNSTTGSVPASYTFLSTYSSAGGMAFGRGANNGLPNTADLLIDTSGNTIATGTITGSNLSGTNTGNVTKAGESYLSINVTNQVLTANAVDLSGTNVTGILGAGRFPALTGGDVSNSAGSLAVTINNSAVTYAKIQNVTTQRLLGRYTAGSGVVQEISLDSSLTLSVGGVLSCIGSAPTGAAGGDLTGSTYPNPIIANLAVTNAKIANSTIDLTTKVTGILPPANGGTGSNASAYAANQIIYQNSSNTAFTSSSNLTFNNSQLILQTGAMFSANDAMWSWSFGAPVQLAVMKKSTDRAKIVVPNAQTGALAYSDTALDLANVAISSQNLYDALLWGASGVRVVNLTNSNIVVTNGSGYLASLAVLPLNQGGTNSTAANFSSVSGKDGIVYSEATRLSSNSEFTYDPIQGILDITTGSANPGISLKTTVSGSANLAFYGVTRGDVTNGSAQVRWITNGGVVEWYAATFGNSQNLIFSRNNGATTVLTLNYTDNSVNVNSGNLNVSAGDVSIGTAGKTLKFTYSDADKILFLGKANSAKITHNGGWGLDFYSGSFTSDGGGANTGQFRFSNVDATGSANKIFCTLAPTLLTYQNSIVGSSQTILVDNTATTNSASHAILWARSGGGSAGSAYMRNTISGVRDWVYGAYNGANRPFCVSLGTDIASNQLLYITSAGNLFLNPNSDASANDSKIIQVNTSGLNSSAIVRAVNIHSGGANNAILEAERLDSTNGNALVRFISNSTLNWQYGIFAGDTNLRWKDASVDRMVLSTAGDLTLSTGNLIINTVGKGRQMKSGTNPRMGTATLVAGIVTIANNTVTANTKVAFNRLTDSGTLGQLSAPEASKIVGTSFVIKSNSATDTSTVLWELVELN